MEPIDTKAHPATDPPAASCALDAQGLEDQRARHRRLKPSVTQIQHEGDVLILDFGPGYDRRTLDELIAVERECCPFFAFSFDDHARRLEVGVHDPASAPALDALAQALTG